MRVEPPREGLPSDEELLFIEDEAALADYDRGRAEQALEKYGDAFRFQLIAARQIERWAEGLRLSPGSLPARFVEGYVQALREVAAHLRQCDYLPGGAFFDTTPGRTGPLYMPSPEVFTNPGAFRRYTTFAARLGDLALAERFPVDSELRNVIIELLAERYAPEDVAEDPSLIARVVPEASEILERRRRT